ncbi:MAG: histidine kinase [Actinobacteria bacterium]|nr:histidine kinase [Actinomycetota bacterium]
MTTLLGVLLALALAGCAVLAVLWQRARREGARLQAEQQTALTEHDQNQVDIAVAAERTRILREMHDVIAHSLAIMVAQADGGSYTTDPAATKRALETIADTGRLALADTRRILGMLRSEERPELSPVPNQTGIAELVADARDAGVAASFVQLGEPRPLPSAIGLALYRICQEALTNVMKHAPAARVVVTENWVPGEVVLTVTDAGDSEATPASSGGLGLVGMQERAEIVGGSCEAGPQPQGGFRVRAVLPAPCPKEDVHE